jgi:hypothetical protein
MYYPKSQIKTGSYTNGDQFINTSTNKLYQGYYYETSNGSKYTGKTPQDGPNILLISPEENFPFDPTNALDNSEFDNTIQYYAINSSTYDFFTNTNTNKIRYIPQFNLTLPTAQDQQNKQFSRYFCKKTNEIQYLEIDKDTYQKLRSQSSQIAWDLYNPTILNWQIAGNKEQVYNSNKASVIAIEQNLKWPGFSQYFQDKFLKYYLGS